MSRWSSLEFKSDCGTQYFERGTALNRVLLEAPFLPRCSYDKTAARIRPRQYAINYPYMQVNRPGMVSWLIFDLDHTNAAIWEDVGLPAPNLIVRNRESGHSHLFYAIEPVCTTDKARAKPIAYMKAVYDAMALRLQADPVFHSGPVAKTPGHPWWTTTELHAHEYSLGKLADHVDLASNRSPWGRTAQLEQVSHSRHCTLFELLRHYAYSIVNRERETGTYEHFVRLLEAFCVNHSQRVVQATGKTEELSWSSVKATAKSVARWTWERYRNADSVRRGVMELDPDLPLEQRQRLAAQRTHDLRTQTTESRIRAACRQLQAAGKALVQSAVAKLASVTRQTVAAYKHVLQDMLQEVLQPAAVAILPAASPIPEPVNFAGHQVSAAPAERGLCVSNGSPVEDVALPGAEASELHCVYDASSRKPLVGNSQSCPQGRAGRAAPGGYCTGGAGGERVFDPAVLAWLREVPLHHALQQLGLYVAIDRAFRPVKTAATERWIVSLPVGERELLVTGLKWFDTRSAKGGGGAIDLLMHLEDLDFVDAVKRLSRAMGSASR